MVLVSKENMESVEMEMISESDKVCVDCKTTNTPLWRSGPAGPKSLCNACGIRYRKKKSVVGSDKKKVKPIPVPVQSPSPSSSSSSTIGGKSDLRIEVEAVMLRRKRSTMKVKRQKVYRGFGEVEEAACCLMSLSYGSVFA